MKFSRDEIVEDLKKIKATGEKPTAYELKTKYGYVKNSEFFPILAHIQTDFTDLHTLIDDIFSRCDPRDLRFIHGECSCPRCRKDEIV